MPDDFHSLTEAFAELERRADTAATDPAPAPPAGQRHRTLLVAASVVGVAAVATGTALLAGGSDSPSRAPAAGGETSAAAPSETAPSPVAPSPVAPSTNAPSIAGPSIAIPSATSTPSSAGAGGFQIPRTARELADRFRVVLDGSATFSLRDAGVHGPYITGTLTTPSGVTGGFDLQIFQGDPGSKATCEDPDLAICSVRRLDDGSSLATGHEPLQNNSDGVTYQADLVRPDGVDFHMHVSNERDPKGESAVLAAHPPLSVDDMTNILTSDRW